MQWTAGVRAPFRSSAIPQRQMRMKWTLGFNVNPGVDFARDASKQG
jgi:hypothetical protein